MGGCIAFCFYGARQMPKIPWPALPASAGGTNPRTPPIAYAIVAALMVISIGVVLVVLWSVIVAAKHC